jgi:hypothetical protein
MKSIEELERKSKPIPEKNQSIPFDDTSTPPFPLTKQSKPIEDPVTPPKSEAKPTPQDGELVAVSKSTPPPALTARWCVRRSLDDLTS